jgi:ribulose 1,5-bisphosphate synthetase/thiazole synthase
MDSIHINKEDKLSSNKNETDVIVVGLGIAGLMVTYLLTK